MPLELNFLYVPSSSIGYGRMGTNLAKAMTAAGVDVFNHLPEPGGARQPELEHLAHLNTGHRSKICKTILWNSVPTHARAWYKGQIPMVWTMWESRILPPSFRESFHEFDTIFVPSQQNLELFSQYHSNVKLILLGIDPAVWKFTPRQQPGMTFDFLCAGSGTRKGNDLAHKAFRKLWPTHGSWPRESPVPRLILKSPRGEKFYGDRVEMISGRISDEAEVALYARAHCMLSPSRGEGFGLMPLQAMAQGCPTILTDAHGHASFAHLGYGIGSKPAQSAYFIYGEAGDWWEPSLDDLCDRMRYVYENYDEACAHAETSATEIARWWTWGRTAADLIRAIGPDRLTALPEPGPWYEPTLQRFRVVTNRDWGCDIAGARYQFHKGEDAYVLADVKRILFEADLLDPVCLEGTDHGLLPEQISRLDGYRERHNWCQLCGSDLTGPSRADRIYESLEREAVT